MSLLVLSSTSASAFDAGCLPNGPLAFGPPSFPLSIGGRSALLVARERCQDSAETLIVMLVVPDAENPPVICASQFAVVQGGQTFPVALLTTTASSNQVCGRPPSDIRLIVDTRANTMAAFTLEYEAPQVGRFTLYVPADEAQALAAPSVTVAATGCSPCRSGQTVAFQMNFTNPGAPMRAEVKGGVRLPGGTILAFVDAVTTIASGASSGPLVPAQQLPPGLPTISVTVEAAILEPVLGTTISRHGTTLRLMP